jgi:hypothetical protein
MFVYNATQQNEADAALQREEKKRNDADDTVKRERCRW